MTVTYNVFEMSTGRLIAVYDTEDQAVEQADALLRANTDALADTLVVDGETETGDIVRSLTGDALRARVRALRDGRERIVANRNDDSGGSGYGEPFGAMAAGDWRD